jgi:hypothetical protein
MNRLLVAAAIIFGLVPAARCEEPANNDAADLARYDARIKPADRQHWAYQPVKRPGIPDVKNAAWARNPIDRFVLARLEARGWQPSPPAPPHALLRRVHLDLAGLPPTLAEQDAFLKAPTPQALDGVVDDLLSRTTYGERWGRHWLDLVRYAETNGYERDAVKPNVWRYRDYVIRSFNEDKPFDRFVLEQLAGDELADASAETLIASGFLRLAPWDDEPADPRQDRFDQLDDLVTTTGEVFLGLTLGCARCHNHKFDAVTQHDYYRMVAVFNPLERPAAGRMELDLPAADLTHLAAQAERDRRIAQRRAIASLSRLAGPVSFLPVMSAIAAEREARYLREQTPDLPRGYFMKEPSPRAPVTNILLRGQASRPGPQVNPGMPAVLVPAQPTFLPPTKQTTQRRLTLARWIASADNPLTARVIVNRIWQFHFGEGLVRTPSDFGVQGEQPTHPQLLDWLAGWFVREGWSQKKLHRLIMTSNTYRMSKRWQAEYGTTDPEDRLLWRVPYRRLEVEAIRDSMLAVSGKLNPKMYGPSMFPAVPKEALEGNSDPDKIWRASGEEEASRRTIYAHVKRSMVIPLLEVLDLCDTTRSAARRNITSVAPQALAMFNGQFVNRQAEHLAARLLKEAGGEPKAQIELAYRLALCRPPTETETTTLLHFMAQEKESLLTEAKKVNKPLDESEARRRALVQVGRTILNLSEFVYAD